MHFSLLIFHFVTPRHDREENNNPSKDTAHLDLIMMSEIPIHQKICPQRISGSFDDFEAGVGKYHDLGADLAIIISRVIC